VQRLVRRLFPVERDERDRQTLTDERPYHEVALQLVVALLLLIQLRVKLEPACIAHDVPDFDALVGDSIQPMETLAEHRLHVWR
jgi:hypothetical protein